MTRSVPLDLDGMLSQAHALDAMRPMAPTISPMVQKVVCELRVAWEVIKAAREMRDDGHRLNGHHCVCRLCTAVDTYDKIAEEHTHG